MAKKPTNSGGKPWSQNMVELPGLGRNGRSECVNLSRDAIHTKNMAKKPTNSGGKPWSQNMVDTRGGM
eukprot:Pgem_evm1s11728